jgi:hypothetical protein
VLLCKGVEQMQLLDDVRRAQDGHAIENMARQFNITPAQAEAAISAVLPEFSRAVERNTLNRGGLADLIAALGSGRHQAALENPNLFKSTELRDVTCSAARTSRGPSLPGRRCRLGWAPVSFR